MVKHLNFPPVYPTGARQIATARDGDSQALNEREPHMPRAMKICAKPGCPVITDGSYCTEHRRAADKARGNSNQRGYGAEHQRTRTTLDIRVQAGLVDCARCGNRIKQGEPWHLDHNDADRGKYLGPSHAFCNTSAGGRKAHAQPD